jgi:CheY-like chemotaxis protein
MARILVCTDDTEEQEVLARELSAEGHEVLRVADGVDALKQAVEASPHLVFLAEALPVFSAYEACRMMRDDPDVPDTLPIVLLAQASPNPKQMEAAGLTDFFIAQRADAELQNLLVRYLGPLSNTRF